MSEPSFVRAESEPKVTMSAVKLDRDGNVVEAIEFDKVEADIEPGFLEQIKQAAKEGWREGKQLPSLRKDGKNREEGDG